MSRSRGSRVLVAKVGLDGHDRGAKVVARLLRDMGYEVIYLGLRNTPEAIVRAAIQEDVAVIGLSVLSGAHISLTRAVLQQLGDQSVSDIDVVVGGTIPETDAEELRAMGVATVFGVGSQLNDINDWFKWRHPCET